MTPLEAKKRSQDWMRRHGLVVGDATPLMPSMSGLRPPAARAVASRLVVLSCLTGIGFGVDSQEILNHLKASKLTDALTSDESEWLVRQEFSDEEKMDATWWMESVQALAWCLGLVQLDPFRDADEDLVDHIPQPLTNPSEFIAKAQLRPAEEIYAEADLYVRLLESARASQGKIGNGRNRLDEGVVLERCKALDWTVGLGPWGVSGKV